MLHIMEKHHVISALDIANIWVFLRVLSSLLEVLSEAALENFSFS